jgi:hypothetical protein
MKNPFSSISASVRKIFVDIFSDRSNTTGFLGTASDGSRWTAISKVIEVISGKAKAGYVPQALDDGDEYPIAVVDMPTQNNIITLQDTNVGSAVALWVQSSSDWWMVSVDSSFNFIPGATNYTIGPTTFTGQSSFTSAQGFSVSGGVYSTAILYSQGPITYSIVGANYTPLPPTYTVSPTPAYTTSTTTSPYSESYSSTVTPFSARNYTSSPQTFTPGPWFNLLVDSGFTAAPPAYTQGPTTYSAISTVWSRANSYTRAQNFTSALVYSRDNVFWTAGPTTWTRTFSRTGPNTYAVNYTSSRTFTSGGPFSSTRNYTAGPATYNLTQFFTSSAFTQPVDNFTSAARWTSFQTFVPEQSFTSNQTFYSAINYTSAVPNFTVAYGWTIVGTDTYSQLFYYSSTPFSSAPTFTSDVTFTSELQYSGQEVFSSAIVYSGGSSYTSGIQYSSTTEPDSFSYAAILRISNSVNNIVSDISSAVVSTAQTIKSIIVQASGNTITAKAFSDTGAVTQLGNDLIYQATGAIINTRYGISLSTAEYSNDQIAASIKIERQ